jgi:uncharacterized protein
MLEIPPILPNARSQAAEPVSAAERIETLDVLRGLALFGILLVNMALFSWPVYQFALGEPVWTAGVDRIADWAVRVLAEGKFYPLFSLLFGAGVAIQMERAEARGAAFAGRYVRRLLVLLGIGLLHAFLIWEGDILVLYALTGFLLLAFSRRRPGTLLVWALIALTIPVMIYVGIWGMMMVGSLVPEVAETIERELAATAETYAYLTEDNIRVFSQGGLGEIFVQRARNIAFLYSYSWMYGPMVLAMFLCGMYAGRRGIFQNVEANRGLIWRVTVVGLYVGLPLNLVYAFCYGSAGSLWVVAMASLAVGGPALCLFYSGAVTLLLRRDSWRLRLRPVAAAGRMALSNYLLQSVICTTIFYSYGFGLYGSVGRTAGLTLAIIIYAAQLPLSVWWLGRFRYGPIEWLWRSLTYGRRQPMRR